MTDEERAIVNARANARVAEKAARADRETAALQAEAARAAVTARFATPEALLL